MVMGVRWETTKGVLAETVREVSLNKKNSIFPFIKKENILIMRFLSLSGQEIVYFEDHETLSLPILLDLEKTIELNFGFKPELVVKTDQGFISWHDFFSTIEQRIHFLPTSKYDTF